MRQIEAIGQMLGEILRLALGGRRTEALGMFDQAYRPLLGIGAKVAGTLTEGQLLELLAQTGGTDRRRVTLLAELLKVEADVYDEVGATADALPRYLRALGLTARLAAEPPGSRGLPDPRLAADLADRLGAFALAPAANLQRSRVYEALGRFGDAEDALFEAIDTNPAASEPTEAGIALYRRLLTLDDAALAAGNLPRDEVEAALADLLRRQLHTPPEPA
jgi:tetratricopeptide (TPR) repeat protein